MLSTVPQVVIMVICHLIKWLMNPKKLMLIPISSAMTTKINRILAHWTSLYLSRSIREINRTEAYASALHSLVQWSSFCGRSNTSTQSLDRRLEEISRERERDKQQANKKSTISWHCWNKEMAIMKVQSGKQAAWLAH